MENGKENGSYHIVCWGYRGIMEKKMELLYSMLRHRKNTVFIFPCLPSCGEAFRRSGEELGNC